MRPKLSEHTLKCGSFFGLVNFCPALEPLSLGLYRYNWPCGSCRPSPPPPPPPPALGHPAYGAAACYCLFLLWVTFITNKCQSSQGWASLGFNRGKEEALRWHERERERGRQTGRQTDRQTDRQTGRQVGRQAGRQTDLRIPKRRLEMREENRQIRHIQ